METFKQIKEMMKNQGVTQVELAEITGILQPNISRMLSGEQDIMLSTLEDIAAALNHRVALVPDPPKK